MHDVGAMDEITMRRIDTLCIPPKRTFTAEEVRCIRAKVHVSQGVFAALLGIGKTTVQQWEQGVKKPGGSACRLLDILDRKVLDAFA